MKNGEPSCIVPGCKFQCKSDKYTYPLPESKEIWMKWLEKLERPNFEASSTSVICYKHFHDHDYMFGHVMTQNGNVKLKKILKPTAIPSLELSSMKNAKKVDIPLIDLKPKKKGWYTCTSCFNEKPFLHFFELVAHYCEIHGFQTLLPISKLRSRYDEMMTPKDFIEKERKLSETGWTCQICGTGETFHFKFELVRHWLQNHAIKDHIYEACQWCSEVFISTESSAKVIL